jgi:anti-sigma factor RsiW
MAHVEDGTLNALLDGEVPPEEAVAVRAHLASCAECAARFEEAKRFLADAADLLSALAPPAQQRAPAVAPPAPWAGPAVPALASPAQAGGPPRRVSKTAREVAIDIDGATHKSPAIPPNFPREGEVIPRPLFEGSAPARRAGRATDWPTLAWAASVVLALGVGYLANEVKHARQPLAPSETALASAPAGTAPPSRGLARATPRTPRSGAGGERVKSGAGNVPRLTALAHKPAAAQGRKVVRPRAAEAAPPTLADAIRPTPPSAGAGGAVPTAPSLTTGVTAGPPAGAPAEARADQELGRAAPSPAPTRAGNLASARQAPAAAARAPAARDRAAAAPPRPAFRSSDVDEAAARLSGNLRFVEGLALEGVKIGPGSLVPGADPAQDVVRVVYADPQGRRLQLDQQRIPLPRDTGLAARERALPAALGLSWGDTLGTIGPGGVARLRWLDRSGLWISLSGNVPEDSLRALLARVR